MSPGEDGNGFVALEVDGDGFVILGTGGEEIVSQVVVGGDGNEAGRLADDEPVVGHGTGVEVDELEVDLFYLQFQEVVSIFPRVVAAL